MVVFWWVKLFKGRTLYGKDLMKTKMLMMIGMMVFGFLLSPQAFACGCKGGCSSGSCSHEAPVCSEAPSLSSASAASSRAAVNVGNTICPVMGNPIQVKDGVAKVTYEYKGRVFNLCCAGCIAVFKKNPEKYSALADKQS